MKYACNLIIDSCCDLPYDLVAREGVHIVKYPYQMDGRELEDDLWRSSKPKDFYKLMRKGSKPTTAASSLLALTSAFTAAALEGTPTVFLSFSSALSAAFERTCKIAEQVSQSYPNFELYVVDTRLASMGEALLVFEAMRQQEAGMTAKELAEWAEEAKNFVHVYFTTDDLKALERGGRLDPSQVIRGNRVDSKPILYLASDGTITVKCMARGRKRALQTLADIFVNRADISNSQPYACIGNADCEKDMRKLEKRINKGIDKALKSGSTNITARREPIYIESNLGPVITSHVGPGAVVLAFWGPDRREDISVADKIARQVRS